MCYNVGEPPLPDAEVMKEAHVNVDQATAVKEAKKIVVTAPATPAPAKSGGFIGWLMEK
jgi:hypothetical protein